MGWFTVNTWGKKTKSPFSRPPPYSSCMFVMSSMHAHIFSTIKHFVSQLMMLTLKLGSFSINLSKHPWSLEYLPCQTHTVCGPAWMTYVKIRVWRRFPSISSCACTCVCFYQKSKPKALDLKESFNFHSTVMPLFCVI